MICIAALEQRAGNIPVKPVDERSHTECGDDGSKAHNRRNATNGPVTSNVHRQSKCNASKIRDDSDGLEFSKLPVFGADQCNGIVGRNTHVGSHVQGWAKAQKYETK